MKTYVCLKFRENLKSAAGAEKAQKEWVVFVNLYFLELFLHVFFFLILLIWSPDLVFVIDDWTLHKQLTCLCVYKGEYE